MNGSYVEVALISKSEDKPESVSVTGVLSREDIDKSDGVRFV